MHMRTMANLAQSFGLKLHARCWVWAARAARAVAAAALPRVRVGAGQAGVGHCYNMLKRAENWATGGGSMQCRMGVE